MLQQFQLSEQDIRELNAYGLRWEAIVEASNQWLIVYGLRLPEGFKQKEVDLAIQMMPGYPVAQLDMAYFSPAIHRIDDAQIPATITQQFLGKTWQRWSRHRTAANPWRPDLDNILSHISLIESWLEKESQKNAILA